MTQDIYEKLAKHLSSLGMGYPEKAELLEILKENFTPLEARIALAIPSKVIPFKLAGIEEIASGADMPVAELQPILTSLTHRGLIYSGKTKNGRIGYALQQFGYGFPQTFFWGGPDRPKARRMADLIVKYSKRNELYQAYGRTETKPMRFMPIAQSIDPETHAVFPYEMIEEVVKKANKIAVAHCACRVTAQLLGRRECSHELQNCIKYDELAEYVIDQGLAKEVSVDEALHVIRVSEEAGLVHLVDNAREGIKHTCNCCKCCCWAVGTIRRRKLPRDVLMATYFLRETDRDKCTGCGQCSYACPVDAVTMENGFPEIDKEWCIGCGVCAVPCDASAVVLVRKSDAVPPKDFKELHRKILKERMSL